MCGLKAGSFPAHCQQCRYTDSLVDGGRRHRDELPYPPLPSLTKLGATMETWRVNRGMLEVLVCESLLGIKPLPAWSSLSTGSSLPIQVKALPGTAPVPYLEALGNCWDQYVPTSLARRYSVLTSFSLWIRESSPPKTAS